MTKIATTRLQPLFKFLDGLTERADEQQLGSVLRHLDITVDDSRGILPF